PPISKALNTLKIGSGRLAFYLIPETPDEPVISGAVSYAPGVSAGGASFDGSSFISYPLSPPSDEAGSVAFWFQKNSADSEGGVLHFGTLGQANSIGVFYANQGDAAFEARDSAGTLVQISAAGVLSQAEFTHIVTTWRIDDTGAHMWLFVNGGYVTYGRLDGAFDHSGATLQLGTTGWWGNGEGVVDELRVFDWPLSDSEVYAEYVYSSNRHRRQPTGKPVSTGPVQVIGKGLYVDGKPFEVKGVGYQPTPIGFYPWEYSVYTDAAILSRDIPLLKAMNVNTVRTWGEIPNAVLLDALYYDADEPIRALLGSWVATSGIDYADPSTIAQYENEFRAFVAQFKNHPAVLGWLIGNEVNLSLTGDDLANWYLLANRLAEVAYIEEGAAYHPTIIVNGGMWDLGNVDNNSDDISMNYVDMWGHNTYFGWDAHCYFDYYDRLSAKPLVFTEFGIDAWDNQSGAEYQATQAAYEVHQWRQIESGCVGGTVMAFSDEWWKDMLADDPDSQDFGGYATHYHPDGYSNEEWYGVVAVADNASGPDGVYPRQAYYALGQEFAYSAGDYDDDGDVDMIDIVAFQTCCGLPASGVCGIVFDFVVDGEVNGLDLPSLAICMNGPDQSPTCAP
ncbi:MAG: hypothetical protein JXO22_00460, partial [Phycisphaerae bacterium]|nr:hypothetical protein [Phycisphaerae bacterium]